MFHTRRRRPRVTSYERQRVRRPVLEGERGARSRRSTAPRSTRRPSGWRRVRDGGGRLFILGVGGSAGHASHAVNDFRKMCGFEAYAPTDNVSELTARVNDEGWDTSFSEWLKVSRLVGARRRARLLRRRRQQREERLREPGARARAGARSVGAKIFGIVGKDGGFTRRSADACVIIPTVLARARSRRTPRACAPWSGTCWSATRR